MVRTLLCFSLIFFVSASADAQTQQLNRVDVIDYGIYTAAPRDVIAEKDTGAGKIQPVSDYKLVTHTDTVQARLGLRFGLTYVVVGQPKGKEVKLTWITHYPPQGVVNANGEKF